MEPRLKRSRL